MEFSPAKIKVLRNFLRKNPDECSQVLLGFSPSTILHFLKGFSVKSTYQVISLFPPLVAAQILEKMEEELTFQYFNHFESYIGVTFLRVMEEDFKNKILSKLEPAKKLTMESLLKFPEGTLGSLMNPTPLILRPSYTVKEALKLIRKHKSLYSRFSMVTDTQNLLIGVISFKELFYADKKALISDIMKTSIKALNPELSLSYALKDPIWDQFSSVPIVDSSRKLLGVIRYDNLQESYIRLPDDPLKKAGEGIGEVLSIAINATMVALNLEKKK